MMAKSAKETKSKNKGLKSFLALDTETTGLNIHLGDRPFAVSACDDTGKTYFWEWPVAPATCKPIPFSKDIEDIRKLIRKYSKEGSGIIFHNAKFDLKVLASIGIEIPDGTVVEDTLVMSHVLDSNEAHGLKPLAKKYCKIDTDDEETLKEHVRKARREATRLGIPIPESVETSYWIPKAVWPEDTTLKRYAVQDVRRTVLLYKIFCQGLTEEGLWDNYHREIQLIPIVLGMEQRGMYLRKTVLQKMVRNFTEQADEAEKIIQTIASRGDYPGRLDGKPFNIRSSQAVRWLLHDHLGLPSLKATASGEPSTDKEALEHLHTNYAGRKHSTTDKVLNALLTYRNADKGISYLTQYQDLARKDEDKNYYLHPSLNPWGTNTTRFSSSNPNAQNVSLREDMPLRAVFGPRPGYIWWDIDYNQLELRLFAYIAQEEKLLGAFARGEDVHGYVACEMFQKPADQISKEERRVAKGVNFGFIYGAGEAKLRKLTGNADAHRLYCSRFPGVQSFMQDTIRRVKQDGCVTTLYGYRLQVPRDKAYVGVNYLVQGSAGCTLKLALLNVDRFLDRQYQGVNDCYPLLTVHDELIIETNCSPRSMILSGIVEAMERPGREVGCHLPVEVAIVKNGWDKPEKMDMSKIEQLKKPLEKVVAASL